MLLLLDDSLSVINTFRAPLMAATDQRAVFIHQQRQTVEELIGQIEPYLPRVLLLDGNLNGYKGWDVLMQLRKKYDDILCIGFSSALDYREAFLRAGAQGFVHKDVGRPAECVAEAMALARQLPKDTR